MNLFRLVPGYDTHIYDGGKEALFFVFLSFLIAFFLTRLYTRQARIRGWGSASVGGVHLHHAVPGIVLALGSGLLAFTPWGSDSPAQEVLAIAFGVGSALVLDEWALIFHLDDVYWSQDGRSSIDAVIVGSMLAGILLHTASPFGLQESEYTGSRTVLFALLAVNYLFALICFFKGKPVVGAVGLLVPFVAVIGAARLGEAALAVGAVVLRSGPRPRAAAARSAPGSSNARIADSASAGRGGWSGRSTMSSAARPALPPARTAERTSG